MRLHEKNLHFRFFRTIVCVGLLLSLFAPSARAAERPRRLVPVGHTVGVKLFADGVLVVGLSGDRKAPSPARESGLKTGDIITTFNEKKIESIEHFQSLLQENGEAEVALGVRRGEAELTLTARPEENEDAVYRLGAWIRDSMAGIGTVTFYDPQSGAFGALGHGITDVDTGQLMPLESGAILSSSVRTVKRGADGAPGELAGDFDLSRDRGVLFANTEGGIFGTLTDEEAFPTDRESVPLAEPSEVRTGKAVILANCGGDDVREYEIEIEKICKHSADQRNLLLRVTDEELLAATGGIVQGMSGSPILQDGKLVGAVTHVLVNDPTRGYGILIGNMLRAMEQNMA